MADTNLKIDTTLLEGLIVGRVEPHIYAFSTETVPNYLKVGDTARGVRVRLDEWRKIFPNLVQQYEHSAQIDDETIFRDFAVHTFLEQEKGRTRLLPDTFTHLPYYSKEFFYNPQIQISAESETKRSIFREKDKTKRSKKESAQHSKSRNKSFVMTSVSAL